MAFIFPEDKTDFTAPNGVTYSWDSTNEKWRVKGFKSEGDDSRLPYRIESEQFGSPQIQLVDAEDNFTNVRFLAENGIEIRPAGADQITFDTDALTLKDDFDTALETQQDLVDEVATLTNKVDALEGTIVDGRWTLDNRSVARVGHFLPFTGLSASTVWDGTDGLQFNSTSADGKAYTFAEVNIGDVIRIGAAGSSAVFRCNAAPESAGDCYNIGVDLLNSDGVLAEGLTYSFEFLTSFDPSTYATITYVDAQDDLDLKLTGGTLTGTLTGMLIKSARDTGYAFEVKPGNSGDATAFIHTNGDMKAKKIKIESDLSNASDRPFELKGRLSDGSTVSKDFFYMYANANGTPSAMNYNGKTNSDYNIVNKKFVDDKVDSKVPGSFTYENGHLFYNT